MQKAKKRFFSVTAVLLAVLVALTALPPTGGGAACGGRSPGRHHEIQIHQQKLHPQRPI